jgi:hypothetical protein
MKTTISETDLKSLLTNERVEAYRNCEHSIRLLISEEVLDNEKLRQYVESADGDVVIALNQILNDLEKIPTSPTPGTFFPLFLSCPHKINQFFFFF